MYKRELKSFFLSLKFIDKQPFMGRYKWVVTGTANHNPCWEEAVATDCIKMTKMETTILKLKLVTKKAHPNNAWFDQSMYQSKYD